jgi:hypothetical protein
VSKNCFIKKIFGEENISKAFKFNKKLLNFAKRVFKNYKKSFT